MQHQKRWKKNKLYARKSNIENLTDKFNDFCTWACNTIHLVDFYTVIYEFHSFRRNISSFWGENQFRTIKRSNSHKITPIITNNRYNCVISPYLTLNPPPFVSLCFGNYKKQAKPAKLAKNNISCKTCDFQASNVQKIIKAVCYCLKALFIRLEWCCYSANSVTVLIISPHITLTPWKHATSVFSCFSKERISGCTK